MMSNPATHTPLPDRFAQIMDGLCRIIADQGLAAKLASPLIILIWARLRRLAQRFARATTHTANPHRRPRRPARSPRCAGCCAARRNTPNPLPHAYAWLRRLLPGTAGAASQLRHLLAEPEMVSLLAQTPAIGRIIRPLCHLLGVSGPPPPPRSSPQSSRSQSPLAATRLSSPRRRVPRAPKIRLALMPPALNAAATPPRSPSQIQPDNPSLADLF
ncbi:MAG TPA: hypothetical protein PLC74_14280, partial [Acetobacteraceae bacterium]|nr:hypothetical protein [Acetobacteraceae bacterium]